MTELSLHILDIAQNSIRAKASQICITIVEDKFNNRYVLTIEDDGVGMSSEVLETVIRAVSPAGGGQGGGNWQRHASPLPKNGKKCGGQGLPLLKFATKRANGNLEIFSKENVGTKVVATFEFDHINRLPLGDIAGVLKILQRMNPNLKFVYKHITSKGE